MLVTVASRLRRVSPDGGHLARLGGDEFAALLPGVDPETGARVAARMVEAIRAIPDCPATLSIGVAGAPAADLRDTLRRADEAMYRVKRRGGDGVELQSRIEAMSAAGAYQQA
jgi:diguanylate cyclase (GGDEF)-like protein